MYMHSRQGCKVQKNTNKWGQVTVINKFPMLINVLFIYTAARVSVHF